MKGTTGITKTKKMDDKLIKQLNQWHEGNKHNNIIKTLEELPASELTYTLKNLLGRAYNNMSDYGKALQILLSESAAGAEDALWHFRVGYAYYYSKDLQTALAYFQKSAALGDTTAQDFEKWCMQDLKKQNEQLSTDKTEENRENKSTLNKIAWSFSSKIYTDAEAFNQDVVQYQKDIYATAEGWNPNEVVLDAPEVQIQYEAWIMKPTDLLENDHLTSDDENIFDKEPEDEGYQVEIMAKLKAANGKNFTALEFLMKAHNQQANKELGDHVFFEGIDGEPTLVEGVPTYYIACGS